MTHYNVGLHDIVLVQCFGAYLPITLKEVSKILDWHGTRKMLKTFKSKDVSYTMRYSVHRQLIFSIVLRTRGLVVLGF